MLPKISEYRRSTIFRGWLIVLMLICLEAGCRPRHSIHAPKVTATVVGVAQFGEYPFGQIIAPDVLISHPTHAKIEVDIKLNEAPYTPRTPITEPGAYELNVWIKTKDAPERDQFLQYSFWILLPIEIHTLRWVYQPHPNGFADVEADFLVYNTSRFNYHIKDIEFSDCQLHIFLNSGSSSLRSHTLDAYQMVIIQSPFLPRGEAAILKFKASHASKKIPAGKLASRPVIRGAVRWRGWFTYFKEEISTSVNNQIIKKLNKGYSKVMVLGEPDF
ncbi:MAG: hypothetical protein KatS3mg019_1700 [Fimbriimonadales bacterium]|nr:MAG: hypothetical protein KatS3mg019_1700 [Fimbriimonadales bacterium]